MANKMKEGETEAMETEEKESSSSESESEEEAELSGNDSDDDKEKEAQRAALEKSLSKNPYAYDTHIELITLLQTMGELDLLREARERMSKLFPLTDVLWLSWIKDEKKVASTEEERKKINALFERAVQDYLSVDLWLEWSQFSMGGMSEEGGVAAVRAVLDRALTAAGLHVAKGVLLWEVYREFENSLLAALTPPPGTEPTEQQVKECASQRSRVLALFRRQLACPLRDMEGSREELRDWARPGEEANIDHAYEKAMTKLKEVEPFEDQLLQKEGDEKAAVYLSYLDHEKEKGDPARIQLLYERAVADFALNADLWLNYVEFVDRGLGIPQVALPVCDRALRNVPWDSRLWVAAIRAAERHNKEHLQVQGTLETALGAGMVAAQDFRLVWEAYLDYLRRRVPWDEKEGEVRGKRLKELRDCTTRACEHLATLFGGEGDPQCSLLLAWARCEASHGDIEKAREVWTEILGAENLHNTAATWLEYLALERQYGDHKHVRKVFSRALNATRDWPESISQSWLSFERDQGSLDSFELAYDKIQTRLRKVAEERERENQKSSKFKNQKLKRKMDDSQEKEGGRAWRGGGRDQGREGGREQSWGGGRDQGREGGREQSWGGGRDQGRGGGRDQGRGREKEPRQTWGKLQPTSQPASAATKRENSKVAPPPGYKPDSPESKKPRVGDGPVEHNSSKDNRTVFVSNLDFTTTEEEIREAFACVGTVLDLRLVKDFKGRSKGFCYVELSTHEEAAAALKKDRDPLKGRPMFISKCDPDRQTRQKVFRYNLGMEKNKLFIKGLPLALTVDQLRTMFGEFGTLKDVRLVTYRNGHSKGLAYVDFEDEAAAAHALLKTDGQEVDGHTISVAISRPPERKQTSLLAPDVHSLGGQPREAQGPPRSRAGPSSLLPRSVRLALPPAVEPTSPMEAAPPANGSSPPPAAMPPKSNADFRTLLLGSKK